MRRVEFECRALFGGVGSSGFRGLGLVFKVWG